MHTELLALSARFVTQAVAVERLQRLSGGANNETWSFDVLTAQGDRVPLILRRKPAGTAQMGGVDDARSRRTVGPEEEAALIAAAGRAGVPVPAVRGILSAGDGLGRGFVMDRLEGETRPKRLLHDPAYAAARTRLIAQAAAALAGLHRVDPGALPPTLRRSDAAGELALWEGRLRDHAVKRPVFELALRWLHRHLPSSPVRWAAVHGDFRNGNLLVDAQGLGAVLDWELAHVGDPAEDLGWFCVASWRFGELDAEAGGFGTRQAWLTAYRQAGGEIDAERVRFWEVLGTLRWGAMCLDMAQTWRSGVDRSVERVAVARRTSETELDLLRLLAPRAAVSA